MAHQTAAAGRAHSFKKNLVGFDYVVAAINDYVYHFSEPEDYPLWFFFTSDTFDDELSQGLVKN